MCVCVCSTAAMECSSTKEKIACRVRSTIMHHALLLHCSFSSPSSKKTHHRRRTLSLPCQRARSLPTRGRCAVRDSLRFPFGFSTKEPSLLQLVLRSSRRRQVDPNEHEGRAAHSMQSLTSKTVIHGGTEKGLPSDEASERRCDASTLRAATLLS